VHIQFKCKHTSFSQGMDHIYDTLMEVCSFLKLENFVSLKKRESSGFRTTGG